MPVAALIAANMVPLAGVLFLGWKVGDIVLLEMHMPIMDGPETIAAIRASGEAWNTIPVIALTADAMSGDRERYLSMGMDGYLAKPLVISDLIAEITRVSSQTSERAAKAA